MRRLIALALLLAGCTAASPTPAVAFITPRPSFGGDACALVPDAETIFGQPLPSAQPSKPNPLARTTIDGEAVCDWSFAAGTADAVELGVAPSAKFAEWKSTNDTFGPATQVTGLGSEAWYWPAVAASPYSFLIVQTPDYAIELAVALGDHSRDRDIAVAVAQSALARLP